MLVSIDKTRSYHVIFSINGLFTFNFFFGNDGDFTIFNTYISYAIEIGFRVHYSSVKNDYVEFLIRIGSFFLLFADSY